MGYAFENPTLAYSPEPPAAGASASEADIWFATHSGPYTFRKDVDNGTTSYVYVPSTFDTSSVWQKFGKDDSGGDSIVIRLGSPRTGLTHFVQGNNLVAGSSMADFTFPFTSSSDVVQYKVVPSAGHTLFVDSSDPLITTATHVLVSTDLDPALNDQGLTTANFAIIQNNVALWYSNQLPTLLSTGEADVTLDTQVDGDVVQVDGTITSEAQTVTPAAQAILDQIHVECSALDASSFEGLGSLGQYKPLIDKALEVKTQTLLLSSTLDGVNMSQVSALATQIGDCLGDLTFTLKNSVSIDDMQVLLQIQAFVSAFAHLQVQLQKFQLQVSVTNTIHVPQSLELATAHLQTCKGTIDGVMESMKAFVSLPNSASNSAMSAERQQQIGEAMAALEAIKSMGSTVVSDFDHQAIQNVKVIADAINADTLTSLNAVKLALDQNYAWIKTNNDQTSSQSISFPAGP